MTQSRFNKYEKLKRPFDVSPDQITVCNFAGPAHYAEHLPIFSKTHTKSDATLKEAADIIRDEMTMRALSGDRASAYVKVGTQYDKLADFEFERKKFVLISTQNRPYKNLEFVIDIIPQVLSMSKEPVFFVFTADLDYSKFAFNKSNLEREDPLLSKIFRHRLQNYIFSVPRLPDRVHAAMYHCAAMTLHPSLAEGGVGSYPFMEGMTMGTPGLTGEGDHTREAGNLHVNYDLITYPANDPVVATQRIVEILNNPEAAYKQQAPIFKQHENWTWNDVAQVYRDALWSTSGRTDYEPMILKRSDKISPYFEAPGVHPKPKNLASAPKKKAEWA